MRNITLIQVIYIFVFLDNNHEHFCSERSYKTSIDTFVETKQCPCHFITDITVIPANYVSLI